VACTPGNSPSTTPTTVADAQLATLTPAPSIVLDVNQILSKERTVIEKTLGKPLFTNDIKPKTNEMLDKGGKSSTYGINDSAVEVYYSNERSAGVDLQGFNLKDYTLEQWQEILPQFGIKMSSKPDDTGDSYLRWTTTNTRYWLSGSNGSVNRLRVWQIEN
jgi:hypothetical protein